MFLPEFEICRVICYHDYINVTLAISFFFQWSVILDFYMTELSFYDSFGLLLNLFVPKIDPTGVRIHRKSSLEISILYLLWCLTDLSLNTCAYNLSSVEKRLYGLLVFV